MCLLPCVFLHVLLLHIVLSLYICADILDLMCGFVFFPKETKPP